MITEAKGGRIRSGPSQVRQGTTAKVIFNKPELSQPDSLTKPTALREHARFTGPEAKTPNPEEFANGKLPGEAPSYVPQPPMHR